MRISLREQVRRVLADGNWHTGLDIARRIGRHSYSTGIAAKIRDLRKPEHGGYDIDSEKDVEESRRTGRQVWRFQMKLGVRKTNSGGLAADESGQHLLMSDALEGPAHYRRS